MDLAEISKLPLELLDTILGVSDLRIGAGVVSGHFAEVLSLLLQELLELFDANFEAVGGLLGRLGNGLSLFGILLHLAEDLAPGDFVLLDLMIGSPTHAGVSLGLVRGLDINLALKLGEFLEGSSVASSRCLSRHVGVGDRSGRLSDLGSRLDDGPTSLRRILESTDAVLERLPLVALLVLDDVDDEIVVSAQLLDLLLELREELSRTVVVAGRSTLTEGLETVQTHLADDVLPGSLLLGSLDVFVGLVGKVAGLLRILISLPEITRVGRPSRNPLT